jgi:hypothetical protein
MQTCLADRGYGYQTDNRKLNVRFEVSGLAL